MGKTLTKQEIENLAKGEVSKQINFEQFENAVLVGPNTYAFETEIDNKGTDLTVWVEVKLVAKNFRTGTKFEVYNGYDEEIAYGIKVAEKIAKEKADKENKAKAKKINAKREAAKAAKQAKAEKEAIAD